MDITQHFKLTLEEGVKVKSVIKLNGKTMVKVSEEIGISGAYLSRVLSGDRSINGKNAEKLYSSLGENESIRFLKTGETSGGRVIDTHLLKLYDRYVALLRQQFSGSSTERKSEVVSSLEAMLEKYKG